MSNIDPNFLHGFRIGTFEVVGEVSKPLAGQQALVVDATSDAVPTAVARALQEFIEEPAHTRANQSQQVMTVHADLEHKFVVCWVRGGSSGDEAQIVDSDGNTRGELTRSDSLMWVSRVVFVFCANDPRRGFVVQETKGTRCHATQLIHRLNSRLHRDAHMRMEVSNDRADAEVWNAVLNDERSYVERLEFTTTGVEPSDLGEDVPVRRARLAFDLDPSRTLLQRIAYALSPNREHDAVGELVDELGGVRMPGDIEEAHATARLSTPKGRRTIRVGERSAPFTRVIERSTQTNTVEFLQTIAPDVVALAGTLDMALPSPFLPTEALPKEPDL